MQGACQMDVEGRQQAQSVVDMMFAANVRLPLPLSVPMSAQRFDAQQTARPPQVAAQHTAVAMECQWPTHATPRVSIEPPQRTGYTAQKRKEAPASAPARELRSRIQAIVTPTAAPSQAHPQGQAPPAAAARPTHAMPAAPSPATPGVPTPLPTPTPPPRRARGPSSE